jgi:TATA box-binding protein binding
MPNNVVSRKDKYDNMSNVHMYCYNLIFRRFFQMEGSDDDQTQEPQSLLTSFLFGNVNEHGLLEDDVLDEESRRQISSLGKLGFQSFLQELCGEGIQSSKKVESRRSTNSDSSDDEEPSENQNEKEEPTGSPSSDGRIKPFLFCC